MQAIASDISLHDLALGGARRISWWLVLGIAALAFTPVSGASAQPILVARYLLVPIQDIASCWSFFSRTDDGNKPERYLLPGFGRCQTSFVGTVFIYVERAQGASCPLLPPLGTALGVKTDQGAYACLYKETYRCPPGYSSYTYSTCRQRGVPVSQKQPPACPSCGNPINFASGEKSQRERDYAGVGAAPLVFERFYSSRASMPLARMGARWRHSYDRHIAIGADGGFETVFVARPDGRVLYFTSTVNPDVWQADPDITHRLYSEYDASGVRTGLRLVLPDDTVERYDALGFLRAITLRGGQTLSIEHDERSRVASVSDEFGRRLQFSYGASDRLASFVDPAGQHTEFEYDELGRLVRVRYPDATPEDAADDPVRTYHYENPDFPSHLTGITNENGVRYATWSYDTSGRAIVSEHAGGAERVTVDYTGSATRTVTDALGGVHHYTLRTVYGVQRVERSEDGDCEGCGGLVETAFDAAGFVARRTDRNGMTTTYVHDARGLETLRTEAVGTPEERTVETEWHPEFRLPVRIAEPGKVTTFTYDDAARLLTRTEQDPATGRTRTIRNSYGVDGLLETVDGPRTDVADVTRFAYRDGVLARVENALGHATEVTAHDPHGRALSVGDPNGRVTTFDYDARGRLVQESVDGNATRYVRDAVGNVVRRIEADGVALDYVHDEANRLTAVVDGRGQRLEYTLDGAGNRTQAHIVDAAGSVTWAREQAFDALGRLVARTSGEGAVERFEYDALGHLTARVDGRGHRTERAYDGLGRLAAVTDSLGGVTTYDHDPRDNLTAVTDPRGVTTRYVYDGLDNMLVELSPDRGETHYVSDEAGNRVLATDARGIETRTAYDALGRVLDVRYPDPSEDVAYTYDTAVNGIGRLAAVSDAVGTTSNAYDVRGNLTAQVREIAGEDYAVEYAYDAVDRLAAMTYPSGARVDYPRDDLGRVAGATLTLDGVTTDLASAMGYQPFGSPVARVLGNGVAEQRDYDAAGRLTGLTAEGVLARHYAHDAADNVIRIEDGLSPAADQSFGYDALDRLTEADGVYGSLRYAHDAVGNRTRRDGGGVTEFYDYETGSNRLLGVTGPDARGYGYDAAGNVIAAGERTFDYGAAGRLQGVSRAGVERAHYGYNARGERSVRTSADGVERFVFGAAGELLVHDSNRAAGPKEYVYLGEHVLARIDHGAPDGGAGLRFASDGAAATIDPANRTVRLVLGDGTVVEVRVEAHAWFDLGDETQGTVWFFAQNAKLERLSGALHRSEGEFTHVSISVTIPPPRDGHYTMQATAGVNQYAGTDAASGRRATLSIDPMTRAVTLAEDGFALESFTVDEGQWRRLRLGTLDMTAFSHTEGSLRISGGIIRSTWRNVAWVMTRDGSPRSEWHTLTSEPHQDATRVRYYHTDHLGTPQAVTDETGTVVWQADYRPFGETMVTVDETDQPVRFPGQFDDEEVGGYYNYQRWYEAGTGRYLTSDPIGLAGGINTYAYVDGNPLNAIDREGLSTTVLPWAPAMPRPLPMSPVDPVLPIPDIPGDPTFPSDPRDPFGEECRSLARRIQNTREEIYDKRYPDLENNPGKLPWRIGPGEKLSETVRGHEKLLNRRLGELRKLEDEFARKCVPIACADFP